MLLFWLCTVCVDESLCRVRAKKEERGVITVNAPAKKVRGLCFLSLL